MKRSRNRRRARFAWRVATSVALVIVGTSVDPHSGSRAALARALVAGQGAESVAAAPERETVAFVGVDVLPMDRERLLAGQTVVVDDGRIVAMGPVGEVGVPSGALEIDGAGRFLMPGLGEMHGHLPNPNTGDEVTEAFLFLYVANGLTTVRGMQGHPSQLELRERIEAGELLGPRLWLGSPALSGGNVTEVGQAEDLVRRYHEMGFDLLKVHEGLSLEVYDAIARTANGLGIPFGGHVSDRVGLFHALEAGQATIDHLDNFIEALVPEERRRQAEALFGVAELVDEVQEDRIGEVVDRLDEAGAWVVPTMVLWETGLLVTRPAAEVLAERPEVRYLPPGYARQWSAAVESRYPDSEAALEANRAVAQLRRRLLAAIHEDGSRILLGTDSPQIFSVPGFSIHHEMELWVEIGMTPFEVLETGTRKVAEYFGVADEYGTVAVGKRADLVLLASNPFEEIGNFADRAGVMQDGRWLPEEEIQRRLELLESRWGGGG